MTYMGHYEKKPATYKKLVEEDICIRTNDMLKKWTCVFI